MSRPFVLLVVLSVSCLCCGCPSRPVYRSHSSHHSSHDVPDALPTLQPSPAVAAANVFGFNLFHQLTASETENVFISPTSLMLALAMCYNGAGGETKAAMAKTLQLTGMSDSGLNEQLSALQEALKTEDGWVEVVTANSLWAQPSHPFRPQFVDLCSTFYAAQVQTVDFSTPQALAAINEWVKQKTNGLIQRIVTEQDLSVSALLLLNAVYFEGFWTDEFEQEMTHEAKFTLQSGRRKMVQMMRQEGDYLYTEDERLQAIALPYGNRRMNMIVVLPRDSKRLPALQKGMDAQGWTALLARLAKRNGRIEFPRFEIEYQAYLNKALEKLGMGVAFTPQGDFSAMGDNLPGLAFAKHKTYLRVTEKKTVAAGALAAPAAPGRPAAPQEPFEMIVDHPFLLGIVDTKTGALLFLGGIDNPQETRAGE